MTSPGGGFLEGLSGGFSDVYRYQQAAKSQRRAQGIQDELLTYERAKQLREAVGAQLQQRVLEGQLTAQAKALSDLADRRRELATAAAKIQSAHPQFAGLPPEETVKAYSDLVSNPQRTEKPQGPTPPEDQILSPPGAPAVVVNKATHTATPILVDGKPYITPKAEPQARIPVLAEREKASAAVNAIKNQSLLVGMEQKDPDVANRVARKVAGVYAVGGVLNRIMPKDPKVLEAQVESAMTPAELQYYKAAKGYTSSIVPGLGGKNLTGNELVLYGGAWFSGGAGDPATIRGLATERANRIKNAIAESGDVFQTRLGELQGTDLSPYGFGVSPGTATAGGVTAPVAGVPKSKVNWQKFGGSK